MKQMELLFPGETPKKSAETSARKETPKKSAPEPVLDDGRNFADDIDDFDPSQYATIEDLMDINPTKKQIIDWHNNHEHKQTEKEKERRVLYFEAKVKAIGHENKAKKANKINELYVVETKDHFFKLFENSAMIYAFDLCAKLKKRTPTIHTDKDEMYNGRAIISKNGVVIFKDLAAFRKDLKQIGINCTYRKDAFSIYKLTKEYTAEEVAKLKSVEEEKWKKVNSAEIPAAIFPAFYAALRETERTVFQVVRSCNQFERTLYGDDMLQTMAELIREYIKMANGWEGLKTKEFQAFGIESIHHLRTDVVLVEARRPVSADLAWRLVRKLEVLEGKLLNAKV